MACFVLMILCVGTRGLHKERTVRAAEVPEGSSQPGGRPLEGRGLGDCPGDRSPSLSVVRAIGGIKGHECRPTSQRQAKENRN